jgi:hypothetical protein
VTRDPFAAVPTTRRLWAAAVLCALSLGMAWSYSVAAKEAAIRLFVVAACRPRTPATRQLARIATVALAIALALALGHSSRQVMFPLAVALVLAAPPAWGSRAPVR